MTIEILDYDHDRDFDAVKRIYFEIGWLENEEMAKAFEPLARAMDAVVFPINGEAECVVFTSPGNIRKLARLADPQSFHRRIQSFVVWSEKRIGSGSDRRSQRRRQFAARSRPHTTFATATIRV